jgi:glucose/arabinose dehydrogenase
MLWGTRGDANAALSHRAFRPRRRILPGLAWAVLLFAVGCRGDGAATISCEEPGLLVAPPCVERAVEAGSTCLTPRLADSIELTVVAHLGGLRFEYPVAAEQSASTWYVAEQHGRIIRVTAPAVGEDAKTWSTVALDLRDAIDGAGPDDFSELGLFGLALHPDFPSDGRVFVHYTVPVPLSPEEENADWWAKPARSIISSFEFDPASATFERGSEEILLSLPQPALCHNGGAILFDDSGYLLLGLGDGCRDSKTSQDTESFYGALLRLDIDSRDVTRGTPYAIPPDNPFTNDPRYAPEIAAYGLRNPWRITLDRETGNLWNGDVGSELREEVNRIESGANYGWPVFEGHLTKNETTLASRSDPLGFPAAELCREDASSFSITGGYVYRGRAIPELVGTYVFADAMSGTLYGIPAESARRARPEILGMVPGALVSSFAEDTAGELYVLDRNSGSFYSIIGGPPLPPPARRLVETGLVDSEDPATPAATTIPYEVNLPFFSDGADKERWFRLPAEGHIGIDSATGHLLFPPGTTFAKSFHRDDAFVETRLLSKLDDMTWRGYSYQWSVDQDRAERLDTGKISVAFASDWLYPSRAECLRCHTPVAGHALGLNLGQLGSPSRNGDLDQLDWWREAGILALSAEELDELRALFPPLPRSKDDNVHEQTRARAFLHVNCSNCHQPGGPADGQMDLRREPELAEMQICDALPGVAWPRIEDARIVAPGDPQRSVLYQRLLARGRGRMHPYRLGVDSDNAELIRSWIEHLTCD